MPNKIKKISVIVIFDTNFLRGDPLQGVTGDFIKKYHEEKRITISFFTTEVSREEYKKYILDKTKIETNSFKRIKKLIGVEIPEIAEIEILKLAEKKLTDNYISTIDTPFEKIDFKALTYKAIYYKPPFKEKEKGYKDAAIMETILQKIPNWINEDKDILIRVLSNDGNINDFLNEKTKEISNFKIYKEISELESELGLLITTSVKEADINALTNKAEKIFYTEGDKNTLFYSAEIIKNIKAKFSDMFNEDYRLGILDLPPNTLAIQIGMSSSWVMQNEEYSISKPVFTGELEDGRFSWKSTVTMIKRYRKPINTLYYVDSSGYYNERVLEYKFEVNWKAKLTKEENITDAELLDINNSAKPIIATSFTVTNNVIQANVSQVNSDYSRAVGVVNINDLLVRQDQGSAMALGAVSPTVVTNSFINPQSNVGAVSPSNINPALTVTQFKTCQKCGKPITSSGLFNTNVALTVNDNYCDTCKNSY